jgi:hypothetical protein
MALPLMMLVVWLLAPLWQLAPQILARRALLTACNSSSNSMRMR